LQQAESVRLADADASANSKTGVAIGAPFPQ